MAMRGTAALAMWWAMAAPMRREFEHWHSHEHFPERLRIAGFLRASRWLDVDGGDGVFVLYELASHDVLSSPAYLARLNAPTPWSTALMPHHRGMVRAQCHIDASFGGVIARHAMTLRFTLDADRAEALTRSLMPRLAHASTEAGLSGAHLMRHDAPAIAQTTEQAIRGGADRPADRVLLVCGYALDALRDVARVLASAAEPGGACARDGDWQAFTLSASVIGDDVT
jgi:hypothetical protein